MSLKRIVLKTEGFLSRTASIRSSPIPVSIFLLGLFFVTFTGKIVLSKHQGSKFPKTCHTRIKDCSFYRHSHILYQNHNKFQCKVRKDQCHPAGPQKFSLFAKFINSSLANSVFNPQLDCFLVFRDFSFPCKNSN